MRYLLAIGTLLSCSILLAEPLTIIKLQHKTADQLIPLIKPLLQEQTGISGEGYQLYVKAGAASVSEVRTLVQQLDIAPVQLLISIRGLQAEHTTDLSQNNSTRLNKSINRPDTPAHLSADSSLATNRDVHTLQAIEGQPTLIHRDTILTGTIKQRINGRVLEQNLPDFQPDQKSIYITARLDNKAVLVTVKSQHANQAGDTRSLQTTVSGQLGNWLKVNLIKPAHHDSRQAADIQKTLNTKNRNTFYLKVEQQTP